MNRFPNPFAGISVQMDLNKVEAIVVMDCLTECHPHNFAVQADVPETTDEVVRIYFSENARDCVWKALGLDRKGQES